MNKISVLLILLLGLTFTSCETTDLDLLDDPNQVTIANGTLERYQVAIQVDFKSFVNAMGTNGARLARVEQMGSTNYTNAFEPIDTNYEWGLAYQKMFSDMKNAEALASNSGELKQIGLMRVLKAYTLMTLVDYYGDIPFSEATDFENFPQPNTDNDETVYTAALAMLDEAISFLNDSDSPELSVDFYYGQDAAKWIRLANTLKMNAYVNTRLVDGSAMSKFNTIVNTGNFISSSDQDFVFNYDIVINDQIDSRHPGYSGDYTASGVGRYRSNWLMDEMLNDNDPRIRYYFFRQNACTPGNVDENGVECDASPEQLFCSTQTRPVHYPGSMVFCSVADGYWGRDHGFGGGIPPDTFDRTAGGVYPIGGNYDDSRYSSVGIGQGGGGAGIVPIRLASWSHLMISEMALASGDASSARTHLEHAMQLSIDKVMSFGSMDPDADLTTTANGGTVPTSAEVSSYIATTSSDFASASNDEKWNILGVQHLVSHYGNGSDSYNYYRRTGFPTSVQFTVEPNPGNFVRSFFYPADEANTNPNIAQKPNVDVKIFWDNNPASPGFPAAN